jgi:transcriptional regulator with XRE-family HTH domain
MEAVAVVVDGTRLRTLRLERLLTQRQLADKAGLAAETVNRIERQRAGGRSVNDLTAYRLAAALEVDASELFKEGE